MSNSEYHQLSLDEKRSEDDVDSFDLETRLLGNEDRGQIHQGRRKTALWKCFRNPLLVHGSLLAVNLIMASLLLYGLLHKSKEGNLVYCMLIPIDFYHQPDFYTIF